MFFGPGLGDCDNNPGRGTALAVRVVWNATDAEGPVEGACVRAYPANAPEGSGDLTRSVRVDGDGRARLRLDAALDWRVYAIVERPDDRYCAWISESAELSAPFPQEIALQIGKAGGVCA